MRDFVTKVEGFEKEFEFCCYENTEPIEIGDRYIYFFGGIADVQTCHSEKEKSEINKHDRPYKSGYIDFVHSFWMNCFKIKSTNFNWDIVEKINDTLAQEGLETLGVKDQETISELLKLSADRKGTNYYKVLIEGHTGIYYAHPVYQHSDYNKTRIWDKTPYYLRVMSIFNDLI